MSHDFATQAIRIVNRFQCATSVVVTDRAALIHCLTIVDKVEESWAESEQETLRNADVRGRCSLYEEMFAADILFRVWAAYLGCAFQPADLSRNARDWAAVLSRSLLNQRSRLLRTLLRSAMDEVDLARLDRSRRMAERWSDVLLSVFPGTTTTRSLRFDDSRTSDFANLWNAPILESSHDSEAMIVTAMKAALPPLESVPGERRMLYRELANSIDIVLQFKERLVTLRTTL